MMQVESGFVFEDDAVKLRDVEGGWSRAGKAEAIVDEDGEFGESESFGFRESESLERVKVSDWERVRVLDLRVKF